jgi:hypothetical protein
LPAAAETGMFMFKKNFYQNCYEKTGWVPMQALTQAIALGDVCQIQQGRMQPLLNVASMNLIEPLCRSEKIALPTVQWGISQGVQQTLCELHNVQEEGANYQWTKQVLVFDAPGSFAFHGCAPQAQWLLNWAQIKDEVTLKLTQLQYSFRHIYFITAVASMADWALAVAGQAGAQLEMSAEVENSDYFALLSHQTARNERSKGMACQEKGHGQPAHFFQAKKLVLSDTTYDRYLQHILLHHGACGLHPMLQLLRTDPLNLLKANELNLTTAIDFFNWTDISLNDVELLVG